MIDEDERQLVLSDRNTKQLADHLSISIKTMFAVGHTVIYHQNIYCIVLELFVVGAQCLVSR